MKALILMLSLAAAPDIALAQEANSYLHGGMDHGVHAATTDSSMTSLATEPGQGAFAAIAEIVEILNADPTTDWEQVDIGALREHLVDMENLTMGAQAVVSASENLITFTVSGEGLVRRAIQNMVPAHAAELRASLGWSTDVVLTDAGANLIVAASSEEEMRRLGGLGFFGIMATGAHHQAHHLLIARGETAHN